MVETDEVKGKYVGKEFKLRTLDGTNKIAKDNNNEVNTPNVNFIKKIRTTDADATIEFGE
tara:strand:+ start:131 stop:310 length:180 start_codon:yes stop_codon:yes gene_type:complete